MLKKTLQEIHETIKFINNLTYAQNNLNTYSKTEFSWDEIKIAFECINNDIILILLPILNYLKYTHYLFLPDDSFDKSLTNPLVFESDQGIFTFNGFRTDLNDFKIDNQIYKSSDKYDKKRQQVSKIPAENTHNSLIINENDDLCLRKLFSEDKEDMASAGIAEQVSNQNLHNQKIIDESEIINDTEKKNLQQKIKELPTKDPNPISKIQTIANTQQSSSSLSSSQNVITSIKEDTQNKSPISRNLKQQEEEALKEIIDDFLKKNKPEAIKRKINKLQKKLNEFGNNNMDKFIPGKGDHNKLFINNRCIPIPHKKLPTGTLFKLKKEIFDALITKNTN